MSASKKTTEQKQPSMALYAVVGLLCVIAVVAVLVLNSGMLQRSTTALRVNGTEYSAADMQVSLVNDGPVTIIYDTEIWRKNGN